MSYWKPSAWPPDLVLKMPLDQLQLAHKFVDSCQLNVAERRSLQSQPLKGSLIAQTIAAIVKKEGWYPRSWRPDHGFDGGLIEHLDADQCRIHWKAEVGVQRFELIDVQTFDSPLAAAAAYGRRFFGGSFDGIAIDWTQ